MATTIYCHTCDGLHDVTTVLNLFADNERKLEAHCEKRRPHAIRLWNREQPCPRCGQSFLREEEDGNLTLWD